MSEWIVTAENRPPYGEEVLAIVEVYGPTFEIVWHHGYSDPPGRFDASYCNRHLLPRTAQSVRYWMPIPLHGWRDARLEMPTQSQDVLVLSKRFLFGTTEVNIGRVNTEGDWFTGVWGVTRWAPIPAMPEDMAEQRRTYLAEYRRRWEERCQKATGSE